MEETHRLLAHILNLLNVVPVQLLLPVVMTEVCFPEGVHVPVRMVQYEQAECHSQNDCRDTGAMDSVTHVVDVLQ